jgi:competence protein ComEA
MTGGFIWLDFRWKTSAAFRVALVLSTLAVHANAQSLPDGKGKGTLIKICNSCHDAEDVLALRLNRSGWEALISNMRSMGATGTDTEFGEVIDYLVTHLGPEETPRPPLNINTATAAELESVAGLTSPETAAVLKFVKKTPCKELTDLKKVPEIDYKKIEDRKALLTCAPKKDVKP